MTRARSPLDQLLDEGEAPPAAARVAKAVLLATIALSVIATVAETMEALAVPHAGFFTAVEALTVAVFALEYALRLRAAPRIEPASDPRRARLLYVASAFGVIDLLAILPLPLGLLLPIPPDWLRVLRLIRLLKLARYAPALPLFAAVIRTEGRSLLAALMVMGVLLVLNSGVMFALERNVQPQVFASLPHAMWWTIVTMATVGYGDIVPVTPLGKLFGGFVMILGIAMFAVPAGILATGFAVELRKRDFVVTWQTVARVPLFAGLDAARIAEIARLLKREIVPAKYAVVRRGEPADAMFFIMSGEVEVDIAPTPRRMGRGQFFGEIALLRDTVRTATVTTVSECELLALDVADFRRLLDAHPNLKASIVQVAEQRLSALNAGALPPPAPPA
ncbi:MAG: ion transporter [Candidatus Rokubacteria bacterium]|nr:ion transporter [Candidatus Rokubacteria bacterium]